MRLWYLSHYANSEGSGETAHPHSLSRAFDVRTHKVWKSTKDLTKNQTCSSIGLLCMRVYRLSLRRAISVIISRVGSFDV